MEKSEIEKKTKINNNLFIHTAPVLTIILLQYLGCVCSRKASNFMVNTRMLLQDFVQSFVNSELQSWSSCFSLSALYDGYNAKPKGLHWTGIATAGIKSTLSLVQPLTLESMWQIRKLQRIQMASEFSNISSTPPDTCLGFSFPWYPSFLALLWWLACVGRFSSTQSGISILFFSTF